jgi:LCP family protein required for cell wall assembly
VAVSVVVVVLFGVYLYMTRLPDLPVVPEEDASLPAVGESGDSAQAGENTSATRQRKDGVYTFLLCGTDHNNGGTDTIIVVSYDTKNQTVGMVSVPRDTIILNSSGNVRKINSAYNSGGIDQLKTELKKLLGIPIDFYIKVDLNGFVQGIDALDGIDFEVPVDMNYDDPTEGQELHIHFSKGLQHLDGQAAIEVARYRHDNDSSINADYNDGGRMETQRGIIKAALKKALASPFKVPELVSIVSEDVETDLSVKDLTAFANQVLTRLDLDDMESMALPGNYDVRYNGGYYVGLYPQETVDMVNQYLNPYTQDLTLDDVTITTVNSSNQIYTA